MYYTIKTGIIPVMLTADCLTLIESDTPEGLVLSGDNSGISIEFEGEGFDLEDYAPFLKCARFKGKFLVHFEDHKGEDTYLVHYGPGKDPSD